MDLFSVNSRGYKPHVVKELLGLSNEKFRNWRKILDPVSARTHFPADVMFAYRILQALMEDYRFKPSELKALNSDAIFEFCLSTHIVEAAHYYVLISKRTNDLKILHERVRFDIQDRKLDHMYLKDIVEEHCNAYLAMGGQQISSNLVTFKPIH
ncbi:hypothetical protein [Aliikangiella sp. IMCC44359]|uniref:hypothetical protein n=1 Tax=Aliikangiella sp. IMCC44359 TaxID=3459125 RepID=UPI00403AB207